MRIDETARERSSGIGLVELAFAASFLVTGVLAFMAAVLGSLQLSEHSKQVSQATAEAMSVIETFRHHCRRNFDATLAEFADQTVDSQLVGQMKGKATIHTEIVLDETRFSPAVDLNGDGDAFDADVLPSEAVAVFLRTTVTWNDGDRSLSFVTLVARAEISAVPPEFTEEEAKSPTVDINIELSSFDTDRNILGLNLVVADKSAFVVGVALESSNPLFVEEIRVDHVKKFSARDHLPPTGALVVTTPFTLDPGTGRIDVTLSRTPDGSLGDTTRMLDGTSFSIALYLESGIKKVLRAR